MPVSMISCIRAAKLSSHPNESGYIAAVGIRGHDVDIELAAFPPRAHHYTFGSNCSTGLGCKSSAIEFCLKSAVINALCFSCKSPMQVDLYIIGLMV